MDIHTSSLDQRNRSPDLVVHRKEWNISKRSVDGLSTRLQEVLKALVVFIRPGQGEEVGIVDGPIEWRICCVGLRLRNRRRQTLLHGRVVNLSRG
jgi:hypothetical protein